MRTVFLLAWLLPPADAVPAEPPPAMGEVTVIARGGPPRPAPDPAALFRRLCYEPKRTGGAFAPPADDADWWRLAPDERAQFGLRDGAAPAFRLDHVRSGMTLFVKFERPVRRDGLREDRCTLAIVGGPAHDRLRGLVARIFGGSGTDRHVGEQAGAASRVGWRAWLWTAIPLRGSADWTETNADRRGGRTTWTRVVMPRFYDRRAYVYGELRSRAGARAFSLLTLGYVDRPG